MAGWLAGWMDALMDVWMYRFREVRMDACMNVGM